MVMEKDVERFEFARKLERYAGRLPQVLDGVDAVIAEDKLGLHGVALKKKLIRKPVLDAMNLMIIAAQFIKDDKFIRPEDERGKIENNKSIKFKDKINNNTKGGE